MEFIDDPTHCDWDGEHNSNCGGIFKDHIRKSATWSKFIGGAIFSFWVLAHLYPFAKGLWEERGKTPTIVFVWYGLIAIKISLLWVAVSPPGGAQTDLGTGGFQFP